MWEPLPGVWPAPTSCPSAGGADVVFVTPRKRRASPSVPLSGTVTPPPPRRRLASPIMFVPMVANFITIKNRNRCAYILGADVLRFNSGLFFQHVSVNSSGKKLQAIFSLKLIVGTVVLSGKGHINLDKYRTWVFCSELSQNPWVWEIFVAFWALGVWIINISNKFRGKLNFNILNQFYTSILFLVKSCGKSTLSHEGFFHFSTSCFFCLDFLPFFAEGQKQGNCHWSQLMASL